MHITTFSHNWNNKLLCDAFTTLRLHYPGRYKIGDEHQVILKGHVMCHATVVDLKIITGNQLNEFIARIDTGYPLEECKKILQKMYNPTNFEKCLFDFVLFAHYKHKNIDESKIEFNSERQV